MKTKETYFMIVNKNASFKGNIDTFGSIKIDGFFEGNIYSNEAVYIGPFGKIDGDIEANTVFVSGEIKGNIVAKNKIHLKSNSKLEGEIITKNFIIEEGASFVGKCTKNLYCIA